MRIGIDARFYGPVGKGLGRYTEKLIEHLEEAAGEHEFVVFLRKENEGLYRPKSSRFRKVLADFPWYSFSEQSRFPSLIRRERIDLMHFPHFNVPLLTPCPFVVTIHDLILLRYPTMRATTRSRLFYAVKYAAYRLVIGASIRRAKKIITVSECTKRDILERFRVPEGKVVVTYEAAHAPKQSSVRGRPSDDELLTAHGIVRPYFLYVGNAYPHKNLEMLLSAFSGLAGKGLDAQLVLVGKMDHFYERLRREAVAAGRDRNVIFYGFAADEELAILYRNARAYVFPSLLEGFGLPPLEAMRYGTPVAASDSSCLPEILGEAALYFDPSSEESVRGVLLRIFSDEELRGRLAAAGPKRADLFSWKDCATKTYRVYVEAIGTT